MAEFDFDELDKAVNSLMNKNGSSQKVSNGVQLTQPETDSTIAESSSSDVREDKISTDQQSEDLGVSDKKMVEDSPVDEPKVSADDTVKSPVETVVQKRGQFMDVKHPSADMKSPGYNVQLKKVSRNSGIINPVSGIASQTNDDSTVIFKSESSSTRDDQLEDLNSVETNKIEDNIDKSALDIALGIDREPDTSASNADTSESDEKPDENMSSWPDPIDAHGLDQEDSKPATETNKESDTTSEDLEKLEKDETSNQLLSTHESLSTDEQNQVQKSPFISNPKVEKRPLGVSEPQENSEQDFGSETVETINDNSETFEDKPKLAEQALPDELKSNVLDVEKSDNETTTSPQILASRREVQSPITTHPEDHSTGAVKTNTSSPRSIPPQYTTKKQTQDDEDHMALYAIDSSDLAHVQKKKNGWWIPVIVLVLIALGVLGGYVAYTSGFLG